MIQDIWPSYINIEYVHRKPNQTDYIFVFQDEDIILEKKEGHLVLPKFSSLGLKAEEYQENAYYLFSIDEIPCFLLSLPQQEETGQVVCAPPEKLYDEKPKWMAFAAITAKQIRRWLDNHKFCGKCGRETQKSQEERALICTNCGNIEYPKLCPVIMVGVVDEDKILLTKYAGRPYKKDALIAGFVEVGETLEEAVVREVKEEVGLEVEDIRYYKTQPWPHSDSLIMGFFAKLKGADEISLDQTELAEARWAKREELPTDLADVSLTYEMIEAFRHGNYPG